jgi:hypothetical protein
MAASDSDLMTPCLAPCVASSLNMFDLENEANQLEAIGFAGRPLRIDCLTQILAQDFVAALRGRLSIVR